MPNPKRKHTRSRRDSRRAANWKLDIPGSSKCRQCGAVRRAHTVCPFCGFYRDRVMIPVKSGKDKKDETQK
ncbi:MAG: 50S ribosomal protein L32 [bacterium]